MRREEQRIHLVQKDIRPGQDVDRVLFEQFGVKHTFDKQTRDLLARHRDMLARGVDRNDPERRQTEAQLSDRLGQAGTNAGLARDTSPLRPEEQALLTSFLKKKTA
jgi:hypothetical protein